jgi:galactokinase/mevalonate kinase-like predicted kinase
MAIMIKRVRCPIRIDLAGGSLDIQPIPREMGPVHIVAAAISKYVVGSMYVSAENQFTVEYHLTEGIGTGLGLGTSGAMNLAQLALISEEKDPHVLADRVYKMELATDVCGGVQDQYMSAYGGVRDMVLNHDRVWIGDITTNEICDTVLHPHLLLLDSGIVRLASTMNRQFIESYRRGKFRSELMELSTISAQVAHMISRIGDIEQIANRCIGDLLDDEWSIRKILMPSNVDSIDYIISSTKKKFGEDNIHAKVLGAAGGGCILFWLKDPDTYGSISKYLLEINGTKVIPFEFDYQGLVYIS